MARQNNTHKLHVRDHPIHKLTAKSAKTDEGKSPVAAGIGRSKTLPNSAVFPSHGSVNAGSPRRRASLTYLNSRVLELELEFGPSLKLVSKSGMTIGLVSTEQHTTIDRVCFLNTEDTQTFHAFNQVK